MLRRLEGQGEMTGWGVSLPEVHRVTERENGDLGYMFYPRSVAVAGASNRAGFSPGRRFVAALVRSGFGGGVYPLNSTGGEVEGLKAYTSILDVPEPLDHVISSIPAAGTPQLMRDSIAKGVKVVHLFTAGFSETGTEEGRRLEAEILSIARKGGIRIVGPNGMGLLCPESGLSFFTTALALKGSVGLLSQSGGNAQELIHAATLEGLGFSKVVSYGNAADLNETDYLEFLASDSSTEIIAGYIEGVRDGGRFPRVLARAAQKKPVILLKGGRTAAGGRAASSHTGSLAGSRAVWQALCRQTGAIDVRNLEEIVDLIKTFTYLSLPRGRNVGVVGLGGGRSVLSSDDCEGAGLNVPQFPEETRRSLSEMIPEAGTSVRNPIDSAPVVVQNLELFARTLGLVARSEVIDFLMVFLYAEVPMYADNPALLQGHIDTVMKAAPTLGKPVVLVLGTGGAEWIAKEVHEARETCLRAGFPIFSSVESAARAISRYIGYHEDRDGRK